MDRTAESTAKVVVSAQVTKDLRLELERRAREGDRSLSGEIRRALVEHLERPDDDGR